MQWMGPVYRHSAIAPRRHSTLAALRSDVDRRRSIPTTDKDFGSRRKDHRRSGFAPRSIVCSGALFRRQLQAVADPELGQDVGWAGRVGFELLPQAADKDSQILHLFGLRRAPDLAQQGAGGQDLARVHDEMTQKGEFPPGKLL